MKTPKKSPTKPTTKKEVEDNDDFEDDADLIPAKKPQDVDEDFDIPLDDLENFDTFDDDDEDY
ncbi:hypothetical protein ACFOWA_04060 [Pedobacter lithocola]|uniref:Uncharacterized protein n=1 Tax=Pedobacter lithocola TaxID=1908239 RepID=A0ABV8P7W8_9SPHI